uniref:Uncharacterized protein n=1 Tax=Salix viminalis TaxID=40686 RepID=A0A6N2MZV3_SALVM
MLVTISWYDGLKCGTLECEYGWSMCDKLIDRMARDNELIDYLRANGRHIHETSKEPDTREPTCARNHAACMALFIGEHGLPRWLAVGGVVACFRQWAVGSAQDSKAYKHKIFLLQTLNHAAVPAAPRCWRWRRKFEADGELLVWGRELVAAGDGEGEDRTGGCASGGERDAGLAERERVIATREGELPTERAGGEEKEIDVYVIFFYS